MDLQNTKLYVPKDLWDSIQNILIYECGLCWPTTFKMKDWHPYIFINNSYLSFSEDFYYFQHHNYREISYKDIMEESRNIKINLTTAKEWYKGSDETLRNLALQAFEKEELEDFDFTKIKSFEDALKALDYSGYDIQKIIENIKSISYYSKASAAMIKLNIIRKALNKEYNLHLTKNVDGQEYTWFPSLRFVTLSSTYYNNELKSGKYEKIGRIVDTKGDTYFILNGTADKGHDGLGNFFPTPGVGNTNSNFGFLGCATEEIAKHFGKYFGMVILKAMYCDTIKDIEIYY